MFMQRIENADTVIARPRPLALKLGAGFLFLCLSAVIGPIWLAACALWFAGGALVRGLGALAVQAWRTMIWAGEVVVGR
ncbi:MAG: hypothetical protein JWO25_2499 [Alphaproteobacteria bacterium]|nr:hypothetical protein [Alphaproteobacteria bacterium]MDB5722316.1 hypothetical protein [Alphaproteobacteria bacterium]